MKQELDKLFKTSLISWITFIILGIFLFVEAELTLIVIGYIVGGSLMIALFPMIKTILDKEKGYLNFTFFIEVFMVVAGLIILVNPEIIASILPILIGIMLLVNGINKLQFSLNLKSSNVNIWSYNLAFSIIIIIIGALFLINPFKGAVIITKIIGAFIIVYSVFDMISLLLISKNVKNVNPVVVKEKNIKIIEED